MGCALDDYLSQILILTVDESNPVARVRDLAERLQVKSPSVVRAMQRLAEQGLVNYRRREFVTLTEHGKEKAQGLDQRHHVIEQFLKLALGMTENDAHEDAWKLRNELSHKAVERMTTFVEKAENERRTDDGNGRMPIMA